jgi:glycosyltransferase involved in cell wall biosynthesis
MYLDQAIQSVLGQPNTNLEYIIVDGGSKDGTVDIIRHYEDKIDYWLSEPDEGIYDAMNKGWQFSHGEYIYYLGADDILLCVPSSEILEAFHRGIPIICGNVNLGDGRIFKSSFGTGLIFNNTVHHQGLFARRDLVGSAPFDKRYRAFADFDFNQRLLKQGVRSTTVHQSIALARAGGISTKTSPREFFEVIRINFGLGAMILAFMLAKYRGILLRFRKRSLRPYASVAPNDRK